MGFGGFGVFYFWGAKDMIILLFDVSKLDISDEFRTGLS